nr:MAG TPA: hypothetical protein [Caudoviricetes sp.]
MEQSLITNSHITPPCVFLITLNNIISRKCELFNTEQPSHRNFLVGGLIFLLFFAFTLKFCSPPWLPSRG